MKTRAISLLSATLLCCSLTQVTHATTILDTGVPAGGIDSSLSLDGNDYVAAEFSVGQSYHIDNIDGYILAGTTGLFGDTFTVALYKNGNNKPSGDALYAAQATYTADGWNGLAGLSGWNIGAGNYWVAFEVGAANNTSGLLLPILAQHPLATAFNDGSFAGYQVATGIDFGVRVDATPVSSVPLPATAWLFISGIGCVAGLNKRRKTE